MQTIYPQHLCGAKIDPLRQYCPEKGTDCKNALSRITHAHKHTHTHTHTHTYFGQVAKGMPNPEPVDESSLSGVLSQVSPGFHSFLCWLVIEIDEKQL